MFCNTQVESFFNFFSPPPIPEDDDIEEDELAELQEMLEADYELGCAPPRDLKPQLRRTEQGQASGSPPWLALSCLHSAGG